MVCAGRSEDVGGYEGQVSYRSIKRRSRRAYGRMRELERQLHQLMTTATAISFSGLNPGERPMLEVECKRGTRVVWL